MARSSHRTRRTIASARRRHGDADAPARGIAGGRGCRRHPLVPVNAPYSPAWVRGLKGARAVFRLVPYLLSAVALRWRRTARARHGELGVVMASVRGARRMDRPGSRRPRDRELPGRRGPLLSSNARCAGCGPASLRPAFWRCRPDFLREVFGRHRIEAHMCCRTCVDLSPFPLRGQPPHDAPHLVVTRNLEAIYDIPTAMRAFARVLPRSRQRDCPWRERTRARNLERSPRRSASPDRCALRSALGRDQIAALYRKPI